MVTAFLTFKLLPTSLNLGSCHFHFRSSKCPFGSISASQFFSISGIDRFQYTGTLPPASLWNFTQRHDIHQRRTRRNPQKPRDLQANLVRNDRSSAGPESTNAKSRRWCGHRYGWLLRQLIQARNPIHQYAHYATLPS